MKNSKLTIFSNIDYFKRLKRASSAKTKGDKVMKIREKFLKTVVPVFAAILFMITAPTSGSAVSASFTIIPPDDAQAQTGKTYGEWSALWWQSTMSVPFADNPIIDPTGAKCRQGQIAGSAVFFLRSTTGGNLTRSGCVVPAGKILFLPLLTFANYQSADDKSKEPEHSIRNYLNGFVRSTRELQVNIDGTDVGTTVNLQPHATPLRAKSPDGFFTFIAPENNIFGGTPGLSYDWISDGFYLIVAPLSPGAHTITFGGTSRNFEAYVTYNLIVEP